MELSKLNPNHPSLRLDVLIGRLDGSQGISINLKYRITIEMIITKSEVALIHVGDHEAVY